jgi:putative Holliday junction resolvase
MRYLAIDYGPKHTGLAVCDRNETIASPLTVIEGSENLPEKIVEIIKAENIEAVVLGLPINMDDSHGPQAELVFAFAENLKHLIDVPIQFQDERLSSFAAEQKFASADFAKKKKKKRLDAVAAAEILEAFLEQKSSP